MSRPAARQNSAPSDLASNRPRSLGLLVVGAASWLALVLTPDVASGVPSGATGGALHAPAEVDFARDVKPILSDNCFACHGPDAATREADLRLDEREDVVRDRGGYAVVVPGDREASELWLRVHADRGAMPPASTGKQLTGAQREILGRWIDDGAPYSEHWSFVPPTRPEPPAVRDADWSLQPLDRFVLARLEAEGLAPSPEADRATWLRRVTFDLTGLPPTPEELDAFLADAEPGAFERVVDRLFESPHHAEAMARRWLDAARYADTHGFHIDNERALHRWRDWVIDAFDANKPYDAFVREQLAGDLLPGPDGTGPTLEQRIATGFNRCNPTTGEGGLIEEEWLVRYAADRVETTSTIFLGLTMQCAQCHDHKFDPVSQEDYYRFFAFFHNLAEEGTDRNALAPAPAIRAPYPEQVGALEALTARIADEEAALFAPDPVLDAAQAEWDADQRAALATRWTTTVPNRLATEAGTELATDATGLVDASGPVVANERYFVEFESDSDALTALRLDLLLDPEDPARGIGRADHGNIVLSELRVSAQPLGADPEDAAAWSAVTLAAAEADHSQPQFDVGLTLDGDDATGWALGPEEFQPHTARFSAGAPFGFAGGTRVRVELAFTSGYQQHLFDRFRLSASDDPGLLATEIGPWERSEAFAAGSFDAAYDGAFGPELAFAPDAESAEYAGWTRLDDAPRDGAPLLLSGANTATYLRRTLTAPTARTLHATLGSDDAIQVWIQGELVHANRVRRPWAADQDRFSIPLEAGANELLLKVVNAGGGYQVSWRRAGEGADGLPLDVSASLAKAPEAREPADTERLTRHYRRAHSPAFVEAEARLAASRAEFTALEAEIPMTMVSEERATRRPTHFLDRGNYQLKKHEVLPGTPDCLPPLVPRAASDADTERLPDRLDLADWLLSAEHPLTARVTVNRFWQAIFGTGLVETSEDFGAQGSLPSHPALLDWLAVEFRESGWDTRALLRSFVTSATYRQSSRLTPALLERDPDNVLLARGPSHRLEAEELRDAALASSGLLNRTIGGRSVKPYQPDGLWQAVSYPSSNTSRFRRDAGDALYRRSMYTFWKRTSPPPAMTLFDAPNRESCTVRRSRTNTPLQALALLNEEGFVEAARALAERALRETAAEDDQATLQRAFRLVLARKPEPAEERVLLDVLSGARADGQADPEAATRLLEVGERPLQDDLDPLEVAAWTHVTNLLFNLDAFVTKR